MKTITRDQFCLAGLEITCTAQDGSIPRLWGELFERRSEVTNEVDTGVCYGLCSEYDESTGLMNYLAAVEVTDLDHLPAGFVGRTIPASIFAIVLHKGSFDQLPATWARAYRDELPAAGLAPAGDYPFERYDERSDMSLPEPEVEIHIPVTQSS